MGDKQVLQEKWAWSREPGDQGCMPEIGVALVSVSECLQVFNLPKNTSVDSFLPYFHAVFV